MAEETVRWVVHGLVQGVGFRYFTYRRAQPLSLVGRVRNLPDGTVEILVRGSDSELDSLLAAVQRGPSHSRVLKVERSSWPGRADWNDFQIDH